MYFCDFSDNIYWIGESNEIWIPYINFTPEGAAEDFFEKVYELYEKIKPYPKKVDKNGIKYFLGNCHMFNLSEEQIINLIKDDDPYRYLSTKIIRTFPIWIVYETPIYYPHYNEIKKEYFE